MDKWYMTQIQHHIWNRESNNEEYEFGEQVKFRSNAAFYHPRVSSVSS